jgi:hypothetical protein
MSIDDLIARLEAATEGSRELDWTIHGAPPPLALCIAALKARRSIGRAGA